MKPRLGRDTTLLADEYFRRGQDLFAQTYGETAESVQSLLNGIYPDVGACIHIGWQSSGQSQSYGPRILLLRVRLRFRVLILGRSPGPVHSGAGDVVHVDCGAHCVGHADADPMAPCRCAKERGECGAGPCGARDGNEGRECGGGEVEGRGPGRR